MSTIDTFSVVPIFPAWWIFYLNKPPRSELQLDALVLPVDVLRGYASPVDDLGAVVRDEARLHQEVERPLQPGEQVVRIHLAPEVEVCCHRHSTERLILRWRVESSARQEVVVLLPLLAAPVPACVRSVRWQR